MLDRLEIEQAHIIGQSMGGWSALGIAIDHPDRVMSLTLADSIGGIFTPDIRETLLEYGEETANGLRPHELPLGEHPAVGAQLLDEDLAHSFLYSELGSLTTPPSPSAIMPLLMTTDHTAQASGVQMPTLFVVGEHDPIFPPSVIETTAGFINGSTVAVVENTGHSPYFERPRLWNDIVGAFLQQSSP